MQPFKIAIWFSFLTVGWLFGQKIVQLPAIADVDTLHGTVEFANNSSEVEMIELTTSAGLYTTQEHTVIKIRKPLTIKAADGLAEKPIIQNTNPDASTRILFEIVDGGSLTLIGLELDGLAGTETNCKYLIRTDDDPQEGATGISVLHPYKLKVMNCYLHDVVKGSDGNFFRAYKYTFADSVIFRDCVFDNCGKEGVRLKEFYDMEESGFYQASYVELSNCTFRNTKKEALVVYAGDSEPLTPGPEVVINHCTFNNCGYDGSRVVNAWDCDGAEIKNSIFTGSPNNDYGVKLYGATSMMHHCDIYQVGELQMNRSAVMGEGMLYVDPMYANAWNGDFTLDDASPVLYMADDGTAMGDPRWDPDNTSVSPENGTVNADGIQLFDNFPNPFNPETTISFSVEENGIIYLSIYNNKGQLVKNLENGFINQGHHQYLWQGCDESGIVMPSGIYYYHLKSHHVNLTGKMLLIR